MAGKRSGEPAKQKVTYKIDCQCGKFLVNLRENGRFLSQGACPRCDAPLRLVDERLNLYERDSWEL